MSLSRHGRSMETSFRRLVISLYILFARTVYISKENVEKTVKGIKVLYV